MIEASAKTKTAVAVGFALFLFLMTTASGQLVGSFEDRGLFRRRSVSTVNRIADATIN